MLSRPFFSLFAASLVLLAGAGCAGSRAPDASAVSEGSSFTGLTWRLAAFGKAAQNERPAEEGAITARFSEDGRVSGSAGCNRYFGRYERSEARLSISQVGATRKACPPPVMEREQAYLTALDAVAGWTRRAGRLDLLDASGERLLRFTQQGGSGATEKAQAPQPVGETFVCDCPAPAGGKAFSFTVRTGPGELALWLPARFADGAADERYLVLGQVRAASGAKYQSDGVTVWNKGGEALLAVGEQTFPGCIERSQRAPWAEARRRGVDFRAVGQEPGWHLEIREGERIRFVYDYGEREVVTPAREPVEKEGYTVYHAETKAHDITVTIADEPCTDTMSGERFEAAARVRLDGRTYRGCGRFLR